MSYILDALKKSEKERDSEPVYGISQTIQAIEEPKPTRKKWLWIVPALLIVNILLLLWPVTTPDADPSTIRITDQIPDTADNSLKAIAETEQTAELADTIKPSNHLNKALLSPNPIETQTTTKPIDQVPHYHRNPFAPMPGRTEIKPDIVKTPVKNQSKTVQPLPASNIEKLNRSLLNQALIEQLAPLREEPDEALTSRGISPTSLPILKNTQQYESPSSTVENQTNIPLLRELKSALQREIPALNVSVHIYTDIPEQRMARINGTMTRQGQQLSSDLTLEEIRPDSLILSFRGEKFRLMR
ncbi:general secretion pathway protein GspB [Amphritea sp.]|uniref:general secretion pathway protein GspB n=1 Tax=Amphritea sp. TaxID=1872502 RepID=UPI0025BD8C53|nr:general secretion pathway protein GspB [Amphritea sp.]